MTPTPCSKKTGTSMGTSTCGGGAHNAAYVQHRDQHRHQPTALFSAAASVVLTRDEEVRAAQLHLLSGGMRSASGGGCRRARAHLPPLPAGAASGRGMCQAARRAAGSRHCGAAGCTVAESTNSWEPPVGLAAKQGWCCPVARSRQCAAQGAERPPWGAVADRMGGSTWCIEIGLQVGIEVQC